MPDHVQETYGNRLRVRVCGILVKNETLLMVRHNIGPKGVFWAPPGGGLNFGETAEACLRRETLEETGLETDVGEFLFACEFIQQPLHAIELFFRLRPTGGHLRTGTDPEVSAKDQIINTVAFMSNAEIKKMDPQTLHGIFRFVKEPLQITGLKGYLKV